MALGELEHWLTEYIVGVYHAKRHRGIGTSPHSTLTQKRRSRAQQSEAADAVGLCVWRRKPSALPTSWRTARRTACRS